MRNIKMKAEWKYWGKLLGKEIYYNLYQDVHSEIYEKLVTHTQNSEIYEIWNSEIYEIWNSEITIAEWDKDIECFENFYKWFITVGELYANEKYQLIFSVCSNGTEIIAQNVYNSIKELPIRCLIEDISSCKEKGTLYGKDDKEEYQFYNRSMLADIQYVRALCEQYPELLRVLLLRVGWAVQALYTIAEAVLADKDSIIVELCRKVPFRKIENIKCGLSDSHRCGKSVAKVLLDNGVTVVYKPRSLKKEKLYQQIYQWFCGQINISVYNFKLIDCEDYGWEEAIIKESCHSLEEVKRYFYRLGIQLCICYFLNGSDLHGENVIAKGEFPVIIDLETFSGNKKRSKDNKEQCSNAFDKTVSEYIRDSVLGVGILPVPVWKTENGAINASALHRAGKIKTPFRVPAIKNNGTSQIEITYKQGELEMPDSLPDLNGAELCAENYINEILKGFREAYSFGMEKKQELDTLLQSMWDMDSRYVLRHTQQYSMYRFTSLHPDFMQNAEDRILFFNVLRKNQRKEMYEKEIFRYETEVMLNGDIPYFYCKGDSMSLFSDDGQEYQDYFSETSKEIWARKRSRLGKEDLARQLMLISSSMLVLREGKPDRGYQQIYYKGIRNFPVLDDRRKNILCKVADRICDLKLSGGHGKEATWITTNFYKGGIWNVERLGMSLYDGISGMAIFFSVLCKEVSEKKYMQIYFELCKKMFCYTDALLCQDILHEQKSTGAFVGECSVMRGYLLLWRLTHDVKFLNYAKRHERIVEQYTDETNGVDFLSGDAGLIVGYVEMYECTMQKEYIEKAVKIGERLWENVVKTNVGCGWKIQDENIPLAGMAHGNSGGIYAYAMLLENTHDKKYAAWIHELLRYENSLYSARIKNWKDLRGGNEGMREEHSAVAWCHGAPGILLSRLKLYGTCEFCRDPEVKRDIARGVEILKSGRMPESICLCHGMAGNYLIMKKCAELIRDEELQYDSEILLQLLMDKLENEEQMNANERYTVGMMCGITGAGYALCSNETRKER